MTRSVNQVELINLAIACLVRQRSSLRLDGDAAFAFEIHRIEHLRFHLAIRQSTANLNNAVCQG